jgi:hypothetical protein
LRHPEMVEATNIQARRWERSSGMPAPRACANATVDLEAASGYPPEAGVYVPVRAMARLTARGCLPSS